MPKNIDQRRGDTNGDTHAAKPLDPPRHRRPRKTKTPAKTAGIEHRWTPTHGWRFRPRMKTSGKLVVGNWDTREDAIRERDNMRARQESAGSEPIITFEEAAQNVLDTVKDNEGTWRSYEEHFLTLSEFFGADTPLADIGPEDIDAFLDVRRATRTRGKPPSNNRLRKHLGALTRVFRLATVRRQFSGANPVDLVEKPKVKKSRPDVLDIEQIEEVADAAANQWDRAVIIGLFCMGGRRAELARLTTNNIDRTHGWIRDTQGKTGTRDIPISKPLMVAIDILAAKSSDEFLISGGKQRGPRKEGRRPRTPEERRTSAINRAFNRTRENVSEHIRPRLHPHTMRHSVKTFLKDQDVKAEVRDAFCGHEPTSVPGRYDYQVSPAQLRNDITKALDPLLPLIAPGDGAAGDVDT